MSRLGQDLPDWSAYHVEVATPGAWQEVRVGAPLVMGREGAIRNGCRRAAFQHNQQPLWRRHPMSGDTTVKKVSSKASPHGSIEQAYLVSGKRVSMRLWQKEKPQKKPPTRRDYETVGYVLSGQAELRVEGQTVTLEPGDSWLVPAGVEHSYRILSEFSAIEATSPPAQVHGRDE